MALGRIVGSGIAGLGLVGASYLGLAGEDNTTRNESGEIVEGGELGAFRIRLGDCLGPIVGSTFESVEAVPCSAPHQSEVYAAFMLPDSAYPGDDQVARSAYEGCFARFEGFVGAPYETSVYDVETITPSNISWTEVDDREVLCLVVDASGGTLTGTARDARR